MTPVCLSLRQGTCKTATIWCSPLLGLPSTNQQRNRIIQPRTQDLPLHLLWRTTPEMARTPLHGQICPQHSCSLSHQQIPISPNHGIWTAILPTPQKDLPSSSQAATQLDWGHMEGGWSHIQTGITTNEGTNLLTLQTLESRRQSLAQNKEPQTPSTLYETLRKMNRPLWNHPSHILHSLSPEATKTMEDSQCVPHLPPIII